MKFSPLLLAIVLVCSGPASGAEEKGRTIGKNSKAPEIFDDFDDAMIEAKNANKLIFVVCLNRNDENSTALEKMIEKNSIYLVPEKCVIYRYRVPDDERVDSFRSHFGVKGEGTPITLMTDAWGKVLGENTGMLAAEGYTAWVQKTGGTGLVAIPPDDLFNLKAAGTLITRKQLIGMRIWTLISGKKVNAALLEANGTMGTFQTEQNEFVELDFNHLIESDKTYLSRHLPSTSGGSSFP
jgi:hypothetical protein